MWFYPPIIFLEFSSLLERLQLGTALRVFTTDMLLHDARLTETSRDLRALQQSQGHHHEAMEADVPAAPPTTTHPFTRLEICLKLASVNYALNNLSVRSGFLSGTKNDG